VMWRRCWPGKACPVRIKRVLLHSGERRAKPRPHSCLPSHIPILFVGATPVFAPRECISHIAELERTVVLPTGPSRAFSPLFC